MNGLAAVVAVACTNSCYLVVEPAVGNDLASDAAEVEVLRKGADHESTVAEGIAGRRVM